MAAAAMMACTAMSAYAAGSDNTITVADPDTYMQQSVSLTIYKYDTDAAVAGGGGTECN